jgi:hypothetical protein
MKNFKVSSRYINPLFIFLFLESLVFICFNQLLFESFYVSYAIFKTINFILIGLLMIDGITVFMKSFEAKYAYPTNSKSNIIGSVLIAYLLILYYFVCFK